MYAWQAYNALFAIRCILKYLIETVGETEMVEHTEAQPSNSEIQEATPFRLQAFFEALRDVIVNVPLW